VATLRHKIAAFIGVLTLSSAVVLLGGAAQAQTGYPPPTVTTLPPVINITIPGVLVLGSTVTFSLCGGYSGATPVTITVNGVFAFAKSAITDGCVSLSVTVNSIIPPTFLVGDPVKTAATCGANTVTATGAGSPGKSTATLDLSCAATSAVSSSSGLAFTGADVAGIIVGALLLIGLGSMLVIVQRRRRTTV
jgi:hypothetical protein